nr:MAG TPA: hypothetical protein [Caudoviricetes sp.]
MFFIIDINYTPPLLISKRCYHLVNFNHSFCYKGDCTFWRKML